MPRRKAFTVIELLVVMAVVAVLLSLLVVAVAAATRTGQATNTRQLMASIKQGLVRFQADIGYLPPVLGHPDQDDPGVLASPDDLRKLFDPRGSPPVWGYGNASDDCYPDQPIVGDFQVNSDYAENIQEWYSLTTLAEYLVGYGHHNQDGFGFVPPDQGGPLYDGITRSMEKPPLGIRHPDTDGVWGATTYGAADGSLGARLLGSGPAYHLGPVYGPYIDLKDDRLLASSDGSVDSSGRLVVSFPGEGNYRDDLPKVLCDYWGSPIRYFRRLYAPGALASEYRPVRLPSGAALVPPPTLADIFVLRPFKVSPGSAIDGIPDLSQDVAGPTGDPTTTASLRSAEFALFSAGPDRQLNQFLRYDDPEDSGNIQGVGNQPTDFFNEDNIVEVAP